MCYSPNFGGLKFFLSHVLSSENVCFKTRQGLNHPYCYNKILGVAKIKVGTSGKPSICDKIVFKTILKINRLSSMTFEATLQSCSTVFIVVNPTLIITTMSSQKLRQKTPLKMKL